MLVLFRELRGGRERRRFSVAILMGCLVCSLFVVASACSGQSSSSNGTEPACNSDLTSIQQNIFQQSCVAAGCHSGAAPAGDLDLTGDTASLLVGVPSTLCKGATRVVPGHPSDSLLYQKIAGVQSCGAPMPLGGQLSAAQRLCIEDWIFGLPIPDAGMVPVPGCPMSLMPIRTTRWRTPAVASTSRSKRARAARPVSGAPDCLRPPSPAMARASPPSSRLAGGG